MGQGMQHSPTSQWHARIGTVAFLKLARCGTSRMVHTAYIPMAGERAKGRMRTCFSATAVQV